jgi:hypothetical protein
LVIVCGSGEWLLNFLLSSERSTEDPPGTIRGSKGLNSSIWAKWRM